MCEWEDAGNGALCVPSVRTHERTKNGIFFAYQTEKTPVCYAKNIPFFVRHEPDTSKHRALHSPHPPTHTPSLVFSMAQKDSPSWK